MILIDDVLLIGFILLIIGSVTAVILKVQPVKIIFWGLVFAYGIIVLGLTLFPIPYEINEGMVSVPHNFIPFRSICSILKMGITRTAIVQLCGNIIISVPYGIILTTVKQKKDILFYVGFPVIFPNLSFYLWLPTGTNPGPGSFPICKHFVSFSESIDKQGLFE